MRKSNQERQEQVIQAVLDLAAEKGVKQITTQAIADRVGIAQPTIFRHFKTRDAIFRATLEWIGKTMLTVLTPILAGGGSPDQRLRRLLARQLQFISQRKGLPRLLFSERLHLEDAELKATVLRIMETYAKRVADLIADGIEQGCFRAELDPQQVAWLIVTLIQGLVMRWSLSDFALPLEEQGEGLWQLLEPMLMRVDSP